MRWILTLKYHATSLVYLCALPRKRANLITYKLQEIFGIIGYPMIFHTDNGKEFTAKVVLEFLRDLNPNILAVTGRPRRPSDQGSVENMNKFVKRTLGTVLSKYRLVGKDRNWTEVLGSIQKCWVALRLQSTHSMVGEKMMCQHMMGKSSRQRLSWNFFETSTPTFLQ